MVAKTPEDYEFQPWLLIALMDRQIHSAAGTSSEARPAMTKLPWSHLVLVLSDHQSQYCSTDQY